MQSLPTPRRSFLQSTLSWAGAAVVIPKTSRAYGFQSASSRPRIGAVGTGSRWYYRVPNTDHVYGTAQEMKSFGDYIAVCDVDSQRMQFAADLVNEWSGVKPQQFVEYRELIARDDIDIVHISTPDHWHAKIAIESMLAGKDVYCEKPMTLTIEEGQQMCDVARKTQRIVQVGTQQRSDDRFVRAVAMIQDGRIGEIKKAICCINGGPTSPSIPQSVVPQHLDWDRWLGPAPKVEYRYLAGDNGETQSWSRCHYEFRWWYEYSGGKLTDWGAHHVDIATWALSKTQTGPISVVPKLVKHPVPFVDGYPVDDSQYNTATEFLISATFEDGQEIEIRHDLDNGILFEGTQGRIFVNRGKLSGAAVEQLSTKPLPDGAMEAAYKNRPLTDHFRNFFESVAQRVEPISDVFSHHRALSTCHLAGIAARLNRPVRWDPVNEKIINDSVAASFLARPKREGYQIQFG